MNAWMAPFLPSFFLENMTEKGKKIQNVTAFAAVAEKSPVLQSSGTRLGMPFV